MLALTRQVSVTVRGNHAYERKHGTARELPLLVTSHAAGVPFIAMCACGEAPPPISAVQKSTVFQIVHHPNAAMYPPHQPRHTTARKSSYPVPQPRL